MDWQHRLSAVDRQHRLSTGGRHRSACARVVRRAQLGVFALTALALLGGCAQRGGGRPSSGRVDGGRADGASGDGTNGLDFGPALDFGARDFGPIPSECATDARWIYLVDRDFSLLRYEPDTDTLTPIGTLACPAGAATPFSMSVDRSATAWVLYNDGNVFHVDVRDASCRASGFAPNQMGFEVFGMGFATDAAGSSSETLYISGGPLLGVGGGSSTFGSIDVGSLSVATRGTLAGTPELTGNGAGELWGFFPDTTPMSVRHLDKTNGATLRSIDVASIDTLGLGGAQAWAFAFWGARYYIFYQGAFDPTTGIYRVDPEAGTVEPVRTNIGYSIVGAGVSTCAPIILI